MSSPKTLIVDLREEVELLDVRIKSTDPNTSVLNIPVRSIFGNLEYLNSQMEHYIKVLLLCRSGKRAAVVKSRYFPHLDKVEVISGGWKAIEPNHPTLKLFQSNGLFNYGPQQYMQTAIVTFLIGLLLMNHFKVNRKYITIAVGVMTLFIAWQILTKSCLMTSFIPYSK
jgi:rhodanese-related sulfurtransferase